MIGGFVDNTDANLEAAVKRESYEETGLEIADIKYIGSTIINDWRYASEKNKLMTSLFSAKYIFGKPEPNDDIFELKWVNYDLLTGNLDNVIEKEHIKLIELFLEKEYLK